MFKLYLIICLYDILIFIIYPKTDNKDMFKLMDQLNDLLDEIREENEKLANIFENMINCSASGYNLPAFCFIGLLCFIPIVNIVVAVGMSKATYKNLKGDNKDE